MSAWEPVAGCPAYVHPVYLHLAFLPDGQRDLGMQPLCPDLQMARLENLWMHCLLLTAFSFSSPVVADETFFSHALCRRCFLLRHRHDRLQVVDDRKILLGGKLPGGCPACEAVLRHLGAGHSTVLCPAALSGSRSHGMMGCFQSRCHHDHSHCST